jgi:hypothetical protein
MMITVIYFFIKTNCILLSPQVQITTGWILSTVAMLGSLDGIYSFYQPDIEKNILDCAFYNGFFRNVWAFGVGVTIFMCVTGYGGKVPTFVDREQQAGPYSKGNDRGGRAAASTKQK